MDDNIVRSKVMDPSMSSEVEHDDDSKSRPAATNKRSSGRNIIAQGKKQEKRFEINHNGKHYSY